MRSPLPRTTALSFPVTSPWLNMRLLVTAVIALVVATPLTAGATVALNDSPTNVTATARPLTFEEAAATAAIPEDLSKLGAAADAAEGLIGQLSDNAIAQELAKAVTAARTAATLGALETDPVLAAEAHEAAELALADLTATQKAAQESIAASAQLAAAASAATRATERTELTEATTAEFPDAADTAAPDAGITGEGAASGTDWSIYVDGYCGDWSCAQSAVDSSSIAYIDYGDFVTIAGHDYGPAGVVASMSVGETVTIEGNGAGTVRIVGEQYVPKGAAVDQATGGAMALQTCVGDSMVLKYIEYI